MRETPECGLAPFAERLAGPQKAKRRSASSNLHEFRLVQRRFYGRGTQASRPLPGEPHWNYPAMFPGTCRAPLHRVEKPIQGTPCRLLPEAFSGGCAETVLVSPMGWNIPKT